MKLIRPYTDDKLLNAYDEKMRAKRADRYQSPSNVNNSSGNNLDRKATTAQRQNVAKEGLVRRRTVRQEHLDEATRTFDSGAQRTCSGLLVLLSFLPQAIPIAGAASATLPVLTILLLTLATSSSVMFLSRRWETVTAAKKVTVVAKRKTHHEQYIFLRFKTMGCANKTVQRVNKTGWES